MEYFCKWKGYPDSENTWETSDSLNCQDLINAYEEKAKKEKVYAKKRKKDDGYTARDNMKVVNKNDTTADVEEEEEYEVEKIITSQINKGITEYFCKWKVYPDSENTWETSDNLNCQELLNNYEEKANKKE